MDQAKPSKNSLKRAAVNEKLLKKLRIPTATQPETQTAPIKSSETTNSKKRKRRDDDDEDESDSRDSRRNSKKPSKQPGEQPVNTDRVYLEFSVDNQSVGRVLIALFRYAAPPAVDQFRELCEKQAYKDNKVHRIVPGFLMQAGDLTNTDIEVEEISRDECDTNRNRKHRQFGTVAMLVDDKKNLASEFYITLSDDPLKNLDAQHVVVGQIIGGNSALKEIERSKNKNVLIIGSGIVTDELLAKMEEERQQRREVSETKAQVRAANPILCEKCNSSMKYNKRTKKGLRYRCKSCPHAQYVLDAKAGTASKATSDNANSKADSDNEQSDSE